MTGDNNWFNSDILASVLKIGIFDDEEIWINDIKGKCKKILNEKKCQYQLYEYSSSEELLNDDTKLDLLFLDISLGNDELDGIELSKIIARQHRVWRLVFVTSYEDYVWKSFGPVTLGYEKKPITENAVEHYFDLAVFEKKNNIIVWFDEYDLNTYIRFNDLLYIEGEANYVLVKTREKKFMVAGNLKYWEGKLKELPLVRVHRSFIVNMVNVDSINNEVIFNESKERLSVGKTYKNKAYEKYKNYIIDQLKVDI